MQEKLWKKSMAIQAVSSILLIVLIILFLTVFKAFAKAHLVLVILILVLFNLIAIFIQKRLEDNADKKIILSLVEENKIALCKINGGTYYRSVKDVVLTPYNFWKLDCLVYDEYLETHPVEIIEKFSPKQLSIPEGYCYITYDEKGQYFVIPNAVISNYINLKDKIDFYEKKVKSLKYLNVFYNKGLRIQTFQEMLKEQKEKQQAK